MKHVRRTRRGKVSPDDAVVHTSSVVLNRMRATELISFFTDANSRREYAVHRNDMRDAPIRYAA